MAKKLSTARIPDGTPRPRRACPEIEDGKHTVAYYYGGLCDRCGAQLPIPRDQLTP